jgi:hypothetical protein
MGVGVSRGLGDKLSGSCRDASEQCEAVLAHDREEHENSRRRVTGCVVEEAGKAGRSAIWGWRWWGTAVAVALVRIAVDPRLALDILHYIVTTWQILSQVRPPFAMLCSGTWYCQNLMLTTFQALGQLTSTAMSTCLLCRPSMDQERLVAGS